MMVKQEGEVGGGGRGREREKVEGELIDKNLSSISMGNLLGREGRRCEKKEKKKEEKRRRGEIKTSQYLRRGETRERIPKTTQPHPQNTCS